MPLPGGNETSRTVEPFPGGMKVHTRYHPSRSRRLTRTLETARVLGVGLNGSIKPIMVFFPLSVKLVGTP
jgi:hypothetical protein